MNKRIVSLSVDDDDMERIVIAQQLYNVSTRSEIVRLAIKLAIEQKMKENKK